MKIVAIVPIIYSENITEIKEKYSLGGVVIEERKDIGGEQILQWVLENGSDILDILKALVTLYDSVKSDGKSGKIKIDGIEYEYENEIQLEQIINSHNENKE